MGFSRGLRYAARTALPQALYEGIDSGIDLSAAPREWVVLFQVRRPSLGYSLRVRHPDPGPNAFRAAVVQLSIEPVVRPLLAGQPRGGLDPNELRPRAPSEHDIAQRLPTSSVPIRCYDTGHMASTKAAPSFRNVLFNVAAVACLVTAGGLGWYAATKVNESRDLRVALDDVSRRAELAELDAARYRRAHRDARARADILAAPDLNAVTLDGQPGAQSASGRAFWSPDERRRSSGLRHRSTPARPGVPPVVSRPPESG